MNSELKLQTYSAIFIALILLWWVLVDEYASLIILGLLILHAFYVKHKLKKWWY